MSFDFTVPGQPPSVNHAYRIIRVKHRDGTSHQQLGKLASVEAYQLIASTVARRAKPRDWTPGRQIRVRYQMHVGRDVDCDNVLKSLNDALAIGLEVNDKVFLPCVESKETGVKEPYVLVTIE